MQVGIVVNTNRLLQNTSILKIFIIVLLLFTISACSERPFVDTDSALPSALQELQQLDPSFQYTYEYVLEDDGFAGTSEPIFREEQYLVDDEQLVDPAADLTYQVTMSQIKDRVWNDARLGLYDEHIVVHNADCWLKEEPGEIAAVCFRENNIVYFLSGPFKGNHRRFVETWRLTNFPEIRDFSGECSPRIYLCPLRTLSSN